MNSSADSQAPLAVVLHAYSSNNAGDGLLVQLAADLVKRSVPGARVVTVALDARSFQSPDVIQWSSQLPRGAFWARLSPRLGVAFALAAGPSSEVRHLLDQAEIILAVGGGYLRGGRPSELLKNMIAHWPQLRLTRRYGYKTVYLPQSIGPLAIGQRTLYRRALSRAAHVYVRDDRSASDLHGVKNIVRMPDLAVLAMSRQNLGVSEAGLAGRAFVARDLHSPRRFTDLLTQASLDESLEWAIQSTGRGNEDRNVTERYTHRKPIFLRDALKLPPRKVIISCRLHGSLQALIAGFPSVHLSYERKGWGAFEDLGISEYVLNARNASWGEATAAARAIELDESAYWGAIRGAQASIRAQEIQLERCVREVCLRQYGLRATPAAEEGAQ